MEQLNNLCKYFLRVLPAEKGYYGKYGIGASDWYKGIKKTLKASDIQSFVHGYFMWSSYDAGRGDYLIIFKTLKPFFVYVNIFLCVIKQCAVHVKFFLLIKLSKIQILTCAY